MSKGSGGTRAGSSGNPRGLSGAGEYVVEGRSMTRDEFFREYTDAGELEEFAERLYRQGGLKVDPGDAAFEPASALAATDGGKSIEDSIDGTTDYFAMATRNYVSVGNKGLEAGDAAREWGASDMVRIPYGYRSLADIIYELRTSKVSDIYQKYK